MSHFTTVQDPKITDPECLVQALIDLGIPKSCIEIFKTPAVLFTYKGEKSRHRWEVHKDPRFGNGDVAHVVVRREHIGKCHNDAGWFLDGNGAVAFICGSTRKGEYLSEDSKAGLALSQQGFERKLLQEYLKNKIVKEALKRGQKARVKRVGDEIRVTVSK